MLNFIVRKSIKKITNFEISNFFIHVRIRMLW